MADPTPDRSRAARVVDVPDPGTPPPAGGKKYRCEVHLYPRNGAGFLAVAAGLPGVAAFGATEAEALAAITTEFVEVIRSHTAGGGSIPWLIEPLPPRSGGFVRVVFPQV